MTSHTRADWSQFSELLSTTTSFTETGLREESVFFKTLLRVFFCPRYFQFSQNFVLKQPTGESVDDL